MVTDQGDTVRGTDEIGRFLIESGTEFTYTTELVGAERTGHEEWVATVRIEGWTVEPFAPRASDLAARATTEREGHR